VSVQGYLVLAVAVALLAVRADGSNAAVSSETDPAGAWQNYLDNDTDLEPGYRFPHATCFRTAALAYGLPNTLLLAVARGESDFNESARSRANAHGVMQILWPVTANHLGIYRLSELYDPCTNIDAGARYLKEMLARYDDDIYLALAAYNYGPERIRADGKDIPSGAAWYSSYIFRHLNYVLGDGQRERVGGEHLYSAMGRSTLVSFGEPYRAAAFVAGLEQRAPGLRLDWFRKETGKFSVVLIYEDREDFDRSAGLLHHAGFRLDK